MVQCNRDQCYALVEISCDVKLEQMYYWHMRWLWLCTQNAEIRDTNYFHSATRSLLEINHENIPRWRVEAGQDGNE